MPFFFFNEHGCGAAGNPVQLAGFGALKPAVNSADPKGCAAGPSIPRRGPDC